MDRSYDLLELEAKEIAILDDKDGKNHLWGTVTAHHGLQFLIKILSTVNKSLFISKIKIPGK
jgi:hypothetical protein